MNLWLRSYKYIFLEIIYLRPISSLKPWGIMQGEIIGKKRRPRSEPWTLSTFVGWIEIKETNAEAEQQPEKAEKSQGRAQHLRSQNKRMFQDGSCGQWWWCFGEADRREDLRNYNGRAKWLLFFPSSSGGGEYTKFEGKLEIWCKCGSDYLSKRQGAVTFGLGWENLLLPGAVTWSFISLNVSQASLGQSNSLLHPNTSSQGSSEVLSYWVVPRLCRFP